MFIMKLQESKKPLFFALAKVGFGCLFVADVMIELVWKARSNYNTKSIDKLVLTAGIGEEILII